MDCDLKRSISQARGSFPAIPPGRTSLCTSNETVTSETPLSYIPRQTSYRHSPHPPVVLVDDKKRQRPFSKRTPTPDEEIKRQRPGSGHSLAKEIGGLRPGSGHVLAKEIGGLRPGSGHLLTAEIETIAKPDHRNIAVELQDNASKSSIKMEQLRQQAYREEECLRSFSVQQLRGTYTPSPNLGAFSSETATNRPPTPAVMDVKAERKRKRREKKEREAKKKEEAIQKERNKIEADRMLAELSRNRSMFNGNRDTLPIIGRKTAEVNLYKGKLPKIQECDFNGPSLPENNAVDVIKKHETQIRTTSFLREISQDYINASAELMEPYNVNGAIDIIEKHEEEVGRTYAMYTGKYQTGSASTKSTCKPTSARSRCSSGVSRRVAA